MNAATFMLGMGWVFSFPVKWLVWSIGGDQIMQTKTGSSSIPTTGVFWWEIWKSHWKVPLCLKKKEVYQVFVLGRRMQKPAILNVNKKTLIYLESISFPCLLIYQGYLPPSLPQKHPNIKRCLQTFCEGQGSSSGCLVFSIIVLLATKQNWRTALALENEEVWVEVSPPEEWRNKHGEGEREALTLGSHAKKLL